MNILLRVNILCVCLSLQLAVQLFAVEQEDTRFENHCPQYLSAIGQLLSSETDRDEKLDALQQLREMGLDASAATRHLIRQLNDRDEVVRREIVKTLGIIAPNDERALSAIATCLTDPGDAVQISALRALASHPQTVLDHLQKIHLCLIDPHLQVRLYAHYVLIRTGSEDSEEHWNALYNGLEEPSPVLRRTAASLLGSLAPQDSHAAMKRISALLDDREVDVAVTAALAISNYGISAKEYIDEIQQIAEREDLSHLYPVAIMAAIFRIKHGTEIAPLRKKSE